MQENGPLKGDLSGVEVMGRDISIVFKHEASLNPAVRAIIGTENKINIEEVKVNFTLASHKVFVFDKETEERIQFEAK